MWFPNLFVRVHVLLTLKSWALKWMRFTINSLYLSFKEHCCRNNNICNDISVKHAENRGQLWVSKDKEKGMQKIEQKTEEKYGVDKRLCNSTHEWHLEPCYTFLYFCVYITIRIFIFLRESRQSEFYYITMQFSRIFRENLCIHQRYNFAM